MCKKCVMSKISDPISIYISLLIDCLVEKRNYSMFSLVVIASSCRVTEENLLLFLGLGTANRNCTAVYRGTLLHTAVRTKVYHNSIKLTVIVKLSAGMGICLIDMPTSHVV